MISTFPYGTQSANRLYHACLPFGIEIIDHIIFADKVSYSFAENAEMKLIHKALKYKSYDVLKLKLDEEKADAVKAGVTEGEKNKAIEIVKEMLAQNGDIDFIIKVTKLTIEEIKKIENDTQIDLVKNMLELSPNEIDEIVKISTLNKDDIFTIKEEMGL